jgi:XRE family transcriptional regulator, regulator of sulfur utilization
MNKSAQKVIRKCLGERVQLLRAKRGWSQGILAKHSGLHRNYIGYVERGEVNAGIINTCQIANAFEMTVSQLLKGI